MTTDVLTGGSKAGTLQTPSGVWGDVGRLAVIAAQLGVILVLARAFHLESPAFFGVVLPLAFGGFLVHHWLPRRYQPLFFAALSLTGIGLVFGWVAGGWLVGVGLALIALCHVPVPFRWRVGLVVLAAGTLIAMRSAWLPAPWPGVIWPILGSMFMFRLAIYLYDLKHHGPAAPGMVLSYFFMLPNTVFLLFPVIDFQTFRRTYFDRPAWGIYDEGVRWMFRGLMHLVLYRLVYQYLAISPAEVTSTAGIVQYLVANYGLYLRVSGQFHVIVGLLHLFGFRLPETHRFFYLASSFSDLWRRINIYWKDFMQKMVYLPVIFGLKRRGETTALVGATISVVGVTWFLHSYQWFWLLGTWLFSATDAVFWGILGLFLIANTLREQRRGRVRQLTTQAPAAGQAWRLAVQTAGMFTLMVVLWGFWTSPTFEDFTLMLRAATLRPIDVAVVVAMLGVVAGAAYVTQRLALGAPAALAVRPRWQHPLVLGALPLALFWGVGEPVLAGRVPAEVQAVARQARVVELNKYDAERLQRGYYEQIVGVNRFNGELWEVYARGNVMQQAQDMPDGADADVAGVGNIWLQSDGLPRLTLRPLVSTVFKEGRFTTNRWGMRDRDYEKAPPPGTRRVAVLGPSYVMGSGVHDGEGFESLVEDRLNLQLTPTTGLRYELLNFAVSAYTLFEHALILRSGRVGEFQPHVVLVISNPIDIATVARAVLKLERNELPETVARVLIEAGVDNQTPVETAARLLRPHREALARWAMDTVASEIRRIGAEPVFALVPMPMEDTGNSVEGGPVLLRLARAAGFRVIDIRDTFAGREMAAFRRNDADNHPNAAGHRVIADRLFAELTRLPDLLAPESEAETERRNRLWAEWSREHQASRAAAGAATPAGPRTERPVRPIPGWSVETNGGSEAALESMRRDNWMRVTISKLSMPDKSQIQLRRVNVPITGGRRYALKFWMKADEPRQVECGIERGATPRESLGATTKFAVSAWWQEFTCAFAATGTDPRATMFFDLGASNLAVELSNVELRDLSTGDVVLSTDPAWRPAGRGGRQAPPGGRRGGEGRNAGGGEPRALTEANRK